MLGITDPDDPGKVRLTRFIRGAQSLATFQATIDELLEEASDESRAVAVTAPTRIC